MNSHWLQAQRDTLIYIGDPMCSWCYGFAPGITEVKDHYPAMEFRLVTGGLRPYNTETMATLGSFLKQHWKDVQKRSGQPFNYAILDEQTFVYDTEPACRAVVTARKLKPEAELDFFKAVQHAFYVDNMNTSDPETYITLARQSGIDDSAFRTLFGSEEMRLETKEDFQLAADMGIRGFPSVVVKHNGRLFLVANGYTEAGNLIETIDRVLAE